VDGGKAVSLEPAIVTTYVKAHLDGTVEHKAEFLDTNTGNLAYRLYKQNIGGFSSVLAALDSVQPKFYGFDFVKSPNFSENSWRGEALDDATGEPYTLDSIIQKSEDEFVAGYVELIAAGESREAALKSALDKAVLENEQFLSMLTNDQAQRALDSISDFSIGTPVRAGRARQIESDMNYFKSRELPKLADRTEKPVVFAREPDNDFKTLLFSR
jgi:hypothetical protein